MNSSYLNLSSLKSQTLPFPHFCAETILPVIDENHILNWLEQTKDWKLIVTDFYEQLEFSFFDVVMPDSVKHLIEEDTIKLIATTIEKSMDSHKLELVGITAHKLVDGHRIGLHNDYIGGEETHRFILQISSNWTEANGGYLMLFNSDNVEDVSKLILPLSNTAFGFQISPQSYHAVSTIYNFSRYSIVYTFKENKL